MDPIEFALNQTNQTNIAFVDTGMNYFGIFFRKVYSKLIVVAIILLVGFIAGRLFGNLAKRLLNEFEVNQVIKKAANIEFAFEELAGKCVAYLVYFATIIIALNKLGITTAVLQITYIAVIIIIVISIVLALKDFIPNLFSGFFIHKKKLIKIGEVVKIKGTIGKVIGMTLVETKIKTKQGDVLCIPNSALTKTEITKIRKYKADKKAKRKK